MQGVLWIVAGVAGLVALAAALADRRRARRTRLDRIGWVPWGGILLAAVMIGAVSAALALREG